MLKGKSGSKVRILAPGRMGFALNSCSKFSMGLNLSGISSHHDSVFWLLLENAIKNQDMASWRLVVCPKFEAD